MGNIFAMAVAGYSIAMLELAVILWCWALLAGVLRSKTHAEEGKTASIGCLRSALNGAVVWSVLAIASLVTEGTTNLEDWPIGLGVTAALLVAASRTSAGRG